MSRNIYGKNLTFTILDNKTDEIRNSFLSKNEVFIFCLFFLKTFNLEYVIPNRTAF